jgi:dienelactone hydrolase
LVALIAAGLIAVSLWQLGAQTQNLLVSTAKIGPIPVTIFNPSDLGRRPVVVIAHGFAGSQQLMRSIAATLARNGYIAITFDFSGHGRNVRPMQGGIRDMKTSEALLLSELDRVVGLAKTLDRSDGRVGLVGHSMAAELVVRFAMDRTDIEGIAALSLFGREVTATRPRNLLVVAGAWEPAILTEAGRRIASLAAGGRAEIGVTYGDIESGTARRAALARGAEHIGVIYSQDALRETVDWMNIVFAEKSNGNLEKSGGWIALLFLGLILLAYPLSNLLPTVTKEMADTRKPGWGNGWLAVLAPAIITPLLLWRIPTDFLPILLGDYLAIHFAIYGLLTGLFVLLARRRIAIRRPRPSLSLLFAAAVLIAGYQILAIGLPVDLYVTSFVPDGQRWPVAVAMCLATLIYFLADAALLRSFPGLRGGYAATKFFFVVSLGIAVAINPPRLFFLAIIVPVIAILFIVYGLFHRWAVKATNEEFAPALGNAIALAWAIAVTFPIVS